MWFLAVCRWVWQHGKSVTIGVLAVALTIVSWVLYATRCRMAAQRVVEARDRAAASVGQVAEQIATRQLDRDMAAMKQQDDELCAQLKAAGALVESTGEPVSTEGVPSTAHNTDHDHDTTAPDGLAVRPADPALPVDKLVEELRRRGL